jgi:alpha-tubulin suppressor-like RCC1 family protein
MDNDGHAPLTATCVGRASGIAPNAFPKDDCNDARPDVHGGVSAEADYATCDGVDNDCNPATTELTRQDGCSNRAYCLPGGICGRGPAVLQVVAGSAHFCTRYGDGTVRCWGSSVNGQLGDGLSGSIPGAAGQLTPTPVPMLEGVVGLAAGMDHTCVRRRDGRVSCWGRNVFGEVGASAGVVQPRPTEVSGLTSVIEVTAGGVHTCARRTDGSVWCWGSNLSGQLGDGTTAQQSQTPRQVILRSGSRADQVVAGRYFTCARLSEDGSVWCWGRNRNYELGLGVGGDAEPLRTRPSRVGTFVNVAQIAAGGYHACVLLADSSVQCWGENSTGELGNGTTTRLMSPQVITNFGGALEVAAGLFRTCGRFLGGSVSCSGQNSYGQLGYAVSPFSNTPRAVDGLRDATRLSLGDNATCALTTAGLVRCWGQTTFGTIVRDGGATAIVPGPDTVALALGSESACARLADRSVHCWGFNVSSVGGTTLSPTPVLAPGSDLVEFAIGAGTSCARSSGGYVSCGVRNPRNWTPIPGLTNAEQIVAGHSHFCARIRGGSFRCWGTNSNGQLGDGMTTDRSEPSPESAPIGATGLAAGGTHTCALVGGGSVRCWGNNRYGQLGDGTTTDHLTPHAVSLIGATQVVAGDSHTCALLRGSVQCWGRNNHGQLGDSTTRNPLVPTPVNGLTRVVALAAGYEHTCARLEDGSVRCWGANGDGQLGDGTTVDRSTPDIVVGLSNVVELAASGTYTCARREDHSVYCWGSNDVGQLGNGAGGARTLPTLIPDL